MVTKVVVHSNAKRFAQVIGLTLVVACALVGLKRFSAWWNQTSDTVASQDAGASHPGASFGLIIGEGRVIDGDTIEVQDRHIRLVGIDAPEKTQSCTSGGEKWECGRDASNALAGWVAGKSVSCIPTGKDKYQRTLAQCFVGADDIQSRMVASGWALAYRAYSDQYLAAEQLAKSQKAGIWRGSFESPWDWRKQRR